MKREHGFAWCLTGLMLVAATAAAAPVFAPPTPGAPPPARDNCAIYYFRANDPEPPLNVRSSPEIRPDNVIATIKNGTMGMIFAEQDGWFQIQLADSQAPEQKGWIAANKTEYACNNFSEKLNSFPAVMEGRFVGTGTHAYIIGLKQGQTLILRPERLAEKPHQSYWPSSVAGPGISGRDQGVPHAYGNWWQKPGGIAGPEPSEWRWTAPEAGIYTVTYDSNFKGFSYGPCIVSVENK